MRPTQPPPDFVGKPAAFGYPGEAGVLRRKTGGYPTPVKLDTGALDPNTIRVLQGGGAASNVGVAITGELRQRRVCACGAGGSVAHNAAAAHASCVLSLCVYARAQ
jgi:hypothetical protein